MVHGKWATYGSLLMIRVQDYDTKMDIRQGGLADGAADIVASAADSGSAGEGEDAGRTSVLRAETRGEGW